jgi:hypothetical protein
MSLMKITKHLRRLGAALVLGALARALVVGAVAAQSPPNPPSRFVGSVMVNGAPATAGTLIEARIGSATCGSTTVFMSNGEARYVVDSPAIDPAGAPGCGADGSSVSFFVGGQKADQTGSWANYQLNTVNLTVSAAAATPPPTSTTAAPRVTPAAPVAGNSSGAGSSQPTLELLLVAMALGLTGVGVAARVRSR